MPRRARKLVMSRFGLSAAHLFCFQAEDGIRDLTVTGVQTCALPISKKEAAEKALRDAIANDPKLKDALGAWDAVAGAEKIRATHAKEAALVENGAGFM